MADPTPIEGPVLVTAFEAFDDDAINSSEVVLNTLVKDASYDLKATATLILPVELGTSLRLLCDAVSDLQPHTIVCLGQAKAKTAITIEKVAINCCSFRIPDAQGAQPVDDPIEQGAPAAYFSTLPVTRLRDTLRESGIPADVSFSAGTYICNYVYYGVLRLLDIQSASTRAGFIHLPALPEQVVGTPHPSMALDTQVSAVKLILAVLCYEM